MLLIPVRYTLHVIHAQEGVDSLSILTQRTAGEYSESTDSSREEQNHRRPVLRSSERYCCCKSLSMSAGWDVRSAEIKPLDLFDSKFQFREAAALSGSSLDDAPWKQCWN